MRLLSLALLPVLAAHAHAAEPGATLPVVPAAVNRTRNFFTLDDAITLSPGRSEWNRSAPGDAKTVTVQVTGPDPITITGVIPAPQKNVPLFKTRFETVTPGRVYKIHLTPESTATLGLAEFRLLTEAQVPDFDAGIVHRTASSDGTHTVRLTRGTVDGSREGTFTFRLAPAGGLSLPPDVHVNGITTQRVVFDTGDTATASAYGDNHSLTLYRLAVPAGAREIAEARIEVEFATVTEYKTLTFADLTAERAGPFHCGPFEISTSGNDKTFTCAVGARSEFAKEHEEYRASGPFRFVTHAYAGKAMTLTQKGGGGFNASSGVFTGGQSVNVYSHGGVSFVRDAASRKLVAATLPSAPIAYPVTLTVKVPAKATTRTVSFTVRNVPLPTAQQPSYDAP